MVKLNGSEWKAFMRDSGFWVSGMYHDDVLIHLNGEASDKMTVDPESISDGDTLEIECGFVYKKTGERVCDLDKYFETWRSVQTKRTLSVTCNAADVDRVIAAVRAVGGEVS